MKQYRLKEEHPLKQKFDKLEDFMNKLQISVFIGTGLIWK